MTKQLTCESLKSILEYNPETGIFTNLLSRGPAFYGRKLGSFDDLGYLWIRIHGKRYAASRLAWLYMTGNWPKQEIDHINRSPRDNRFVNLREADRSQNNANVKTRKTSKLGLKGVRKRGGRFHARILNNHLGTFATADEAHAAYAAAAANLFGEFARSQ